MEGRVSTNPGRRWPVDLPLAVNCTPGQQAPVGDAMPSSRRTGHTAEHPALPGKAVPLWTKGSEAPQPPPLPWRGQEPRTLVALESAVLCEGGGALARREAVPMPPASCLPHPAWPPPPGPVPGFSPASVEVAEESLRKLGSLCERPRDTRQPLPSSDAAMGKAARGQVGGRHRIRAS